jgi:hypothetical protein
MRLMKARTWLPVLFAAALTVGALASPAAAHEDPFDPNSDGNEAPTTQDDTGATTTDPDTDGVDDTTTGQTTESLPDTGADPAPWLVLAYALIAVGAGALLVVYVRRPIMPVRTLAGAAPRPDAARSSGSSR